MMSFYVASLKKFIWKEFLGTGFLNEENSETWLINLGEQPRRMLTRICKVPYLYLDVSIYYQYSRPVEREKKIANKCVSYIMVYKLKLK